MTNNKSRSSDTSQKTEYRIYEHPVLKRQIVKCGFSWPAMLIGPAWLIFRKLWSMVMLYFILMMIALAILTVIYRRIDIVLFGEFIGDAFRDYGDPEQRLEYKDWTPEGRTERFEIAKLILLFGFQFLVARIGNFLWEKSLISRGYELKESVQARTMDEVTAILAKQKD